MIDRVSTTAAIVVRHAGAYADLLRADLDAGARQLRRRLLAGALLAGACFFAVAVACAWLIGMTWNSAQRDWILAGLVALFLAVGAGAYWRLTRLRADGAGLLPLTAREWGKDRQLIEEMLSGKAEAS